MKKNDITKIEIQARRWFQKPYGNTYFTACVYVNDSFAFSLPFQYGYDGQCFNVAARELHEQNLINLGQPNKRSLGSLWRYCKENNIELIQNAIDVRRKRDL